MTTSPDLRQSGAAAPVGAGQATPGMHAALPLSFRPMQMADLAPVEAIERSVYAHPWSLANFRDSLASGYDCWAARTADGTLAGYFLLMLAPDEVHLLNITVLPALQGRGIGRRLLNRIGEIARDRHVPAILLEVRPSNLQALAVYRHVGFQQIGIRKGYYPAADGSREDALVMRLPL